MMDGFARAAAFIRGPDDVAVFEITVNFAKS